MNEPSSTPPSISSEQGGRVLVLAPDENLSAAILAALREAAPLAQVEIARSLAEAQQLVVHQRPDLFVLDVDAIQDLGQEFLYDLRTSHPNARAIVLTAVHLAAHREQAAGLGAIHFLEKPFPHRDFVDLVEALLQPGGQQEGEKFQGTLSDLHIADIIQLKCMSGATSVLEFTGPRGEKARVFFEQGQVRHATAPGKEGIAAFNEIVEWKGGMISEISGAGASPTTIDVDWQILLMEAVRKIDEASGRAAAVETPVPAAARKVLVVDDSAMLLNFVQDVLAGANYEVTGAATAEEALRLAATEMPHLILLDYVLPDMGGEEVLRRLLESPATAAIPVVYMSGFGGDLPSNLMGHPNVVGTLHKPFTSELLLLRVGTHMPAESVAPAPTETAVPSSTVEQPPESWAPADQPDPLLVPTDQLEPQNSAAAPEAAENATLEAAAGPADAWWNAAPPVPAMFEQGTAAATSDPQFTPAAAAPPTDQWSEPPPAAGAAEIPVPPGTAFFCGDTSFFSLNWALHAIASQKLTGVLRCFWKQEPIELLARNGEVLLATTRDPVLYCPEAPVTLVNVDPAQIERARQQQRETARPLFITLAEDDAIIREPAVQLVQHYGQKLFAQLWTAPRVRFMFDQTDQLPAYAHELAGEEDVDHWALGTLRFIQFQDLAEQAYYDTGSIPAYTRDGFGRVQKLRLTVAEAQFASQFNGTRSIAQIAKNLRLDVKFARLALFRFLALEIVECWPPILGAAQEKRGVFGRMFGG